jgi:hypothetical protein
MRVRLWHLLREGKFEGIEFRISLQFFRICTSLGVSEYITLKPKFAPGAGI